MGLRPDIPCKKHKNGSIELYATIANTKRGCAYFDTPSTRGWGAMGGLELSGGLKGQQSVSPRHRLGSLCHVTIRPDGAKEYITDVLFEGWGCRIE